MSLIDWIGLGTGFVGQLMNAGNMQQAASHQRQVDMLNFQMQLKNYEMQQGLIDWNKAAQETQWLREDTAVQRRVADMKAAGLNPILAAGQGAPTSLQPVRNQPAPPYLEHNSPMYMSMVGDALSKFADIAHTKAQTTLLRKQADTEDARKQELLASASLYGRQTRHYDTQEMKVIHDISMDIMQHDLNWSKRDLESSRLDFEKSRWAEEFALEVERFTVSKEEKEFYMNLAHHDHVLKQRGLDLDERKFAMEKFVTDFKLEVERRDLHIEAVLGIRHKETVKGIVGNLYQMLQYGMFGADWIYDGAVKHWWIDDKNFRRNQ